MSIQRNSIVQKVVADQVQRITNQIKKNKPDTLTSTDTTTFISVIEPIGYCISTPGTYVLTNDIIYSPSEDKVSAAIVIECDDVTLDFQGYTLTASGGSSEISIGVVVQNKNTESQANLKNVNIKNGTIKNMGLYGLCAVGTDNLSISNITVDGLTYPSFDLFPAGIFLCEVNSFEINYSAVKNVAVEAILAGGIMIVGATTGTVNNCLVDNFTNRDGVASGFPYLDCKGVDTNGCVVTNLTTLYGGNPNSKIGHTCIGFMPTECSDVRFAYCTVMGVYGCCDDCHGMSLFTVTNGTVSNFRASQVHDGLGPQKTGAKATGLEIYGSEITVTNCHVSDITAIVPQDLQATGISVCGTNITVESCTASDIIVYNANGIPDTTHGFGTGFGWAPDPRHQFVHPSKQVTYKDCIANDCQLGFDTWNHEDSTWVKPITTGQGLDHLIQAKGTERVYSMNFCSELPDSNPSSPAQNFKIYNQIGGNTYPDDWIE